MDGRSLIPVAQNPGIEQGRELLVEQPGSAAIRTERYTYAEYDTGEQELYDLQNDPFELRSRHNSPAYAAVRAQLANRLHALQSCAGASCRAPPLARPATPTRSSPAQRRTTMAELRSSMDRNSAMAEGPAQPP